MFSRVSYFLILFVFFCSQAFAAEYEHIRKGQTYEYDVIFQFTNPRAVVLDKRGGKVLIEILEGDRAGEVDWVYPSALLTTSESQQQEAENIVGGIAVGAAIFCALTDSCPKDEPAPQKSFQKQDTGKAVDRRVMIANNCHKTVQFWLAYYRDGEFLGGAAHWTIDPGERINLGLADGSPLYADKDTFFFHARSKDGKVNWSGDREINLGGEKKLPMATLNVGLEDGKYSAGLTCKN